MELKAQVWFPTLIWAASLPDNETKVLSDMKDYILKIKDKKYDYEKDDMPDTSKLLNEVSAASIKLLERINKFRIKLKSNVFIKIGKKNIQILKGNDHGMNLYCDLDPRLLSRILHRKAHWNNAEIGTHINFKRVPNKMEPDVHTCMSFFHL